MLLDFLNQAKEKTLETSNTISDSVKDFLSELHDYFNKPNINSTLSKDNYWIDRIEKNDAVLINSRNRESYFVPLNELPKEVTEKDYWFIKVEDNKYVIDYDSMSKNKSNFDGNLNQ